MKAVADPLRRMIVAKKWMGKTMSVLDVSELAARVFAEIFLARHFFTHLLLGVSMNLLPNSKGSDSSSPLTP